MPYNWQNWYFFLSEYVMRCCSEMFVAWYVWFHFWSHETDRSHQEDVLLLQLDHPCCSQSTSKSWSSNTPLPGRNGWWDAKEHTVVLTSIGHFVTVLWIPSFPFWKVVNFYGGSFPVLKKVLLFGNGNPNVDLENEYSSRRIWLWWWCSTSSSSTCTRICWAGASLPTIWRSGTDRVQ